MNDMSNYRRDEFDIAQESARFMTGVYKWMTAGILTTAAFAYVVASSPDLYYMITSNKILFIGLIIIELGAVIYLSARIQKMTAMTATIVYFLYAALSGVTLSVIAMVYTSESIFTTFLLTASGFAGLSAYGYITKRDLGPVGTFCHMGLWGMIAFGVLSLFFPSMMSTGGSKIFGLVGVIVFAGLTAYDTKKIKEMNIIGNEGTEENHKETIMGALTLYLDFINLFLSLLRLTGNRR